MTAEVVTFLGVVVIDAGAVACFCSVVEVDFVEVVHEAVVYEVALCDADFL